MHYNTWWHNRYILKQDFDLKPTLRYKDVKDVKHLKIFKYSEYNFVNSKAGLDNIACITIPSYGNKHHKDMTLELALKVYSKNPILFRNDTLAHLYSYIAFYDPRILDKIRERTNKYEARQSKSDSKSLGKV